MFLFKKKISCRVGAAYSRGGGERLFVETIFRGALIGGWAFNRGNTVLKQGMKVHMFHKYMQKHMM